MTRPLGTLTKAACLLLLAVSAWSCRYFRQTRARPGIVVLQDFEGACSVSSWPPDAAGRAGISRTWAASGKHSLAIDPGVMATIRDLTESDWTGYSELRFVVHNPGATTLMLGLELQDQHEAFHERHQESLGVPPGDHTLTVDITGALFRGEENRPYRGRIKTPIDISRISRIGFTNGGGATTLYVDDVAIAKRERLSTPFGVAFDFGPSNKHVAADTLGVFETTMFTTERGFGMVGRRPSPVLLPMSYPTPLLGDGLPFDGGGFRVDLKGGRYLGWIAFERGGFWEEEQSGYRHADVLVNGVAVTGHDFTPSGPHFFFEDLELTDLNDIEERLVRPAHAITRFSFDAAAGANVFTLSVTEATGLPLRVAGLVLAPDTPAGAAFIDAHAQRQSDAIRFAYAPEDRSRRTGGRAAPQSDVAVQPMPVGAEMYPRDFPVRESAPGNATGEALEVVAFAGYAATIQLGVYARRDLDLRVDASTFVNAHGVSLPQPEESFTVGISRRVGWAVGPSG